MGRRKKAGMRKEGRNQRGRKDVKKGGTIEQFGRRRKEVIKRS